MVALEIRLEVRLVRRADPGDEGHLRPHRTQPDRLVGARAAGSRADRGAPVRAAHQRPLRHHDDVGHHIADDEDRTALAHARPAFAAFGLVSSLLSATAICAATRALFSTSAMLATRLLPSVNSKMRLSRNGVSVLARHALRVPPRRSPRRCAPRSSPASSASLLGDRVGDQHAAQAQFELQCDDPRRAPWRHRPGGRPCSRCRAPRRPGTRRCR